ncbi:hypothetical protein Hanom_Chr17g01564301 [Helianthus anomalus]
MLGTAWKLAAEGDGVWGRAGNVSNRLGTTIQEEGEERRVRETCCRRVQQSRKKGTGNLLQKGTMHPGRR